MSHTWTASSRAPWNTCLPSLSPSRSHRDCQAQWRVYKATHRKTPGISAQCNVYTMPSCFRQSIAPHTRFFKLKLEKLGPLNQGRWLYPVLFAKAQNTQSHKHTRDKFETLDTTNVKQGGVSECRRFSNVMPFGNLSIHLPGNSTHHKSCSSMNFSCWDKRTL
jgi:hypothetical protein